LNAKTVVQTCTQLPGKDLAVLFLRLTFEGSPGPYKWVVLPETICDLAMVIMQDDNWDPKTLSATKSKLVPKTNPLTMTPYS